MAIDGPTGFLLIAMVLGAVGWAVASNWQGPRHPGPGFIASLKDNGAFHRDIIVPLVLGVGGYPVAWLEDDDRPAAKGFVIWSRNAAPFLDRILAKIKDGGWSLVALDETPIPAELEQLERVDKSNLPRRYA